MDILTVEHLTKVYGQGATARARRSTTYRSPLPQGEFVGHRGLVGFGQVDAAAPHGRRRPPHVGHRAPRPAQTCMRAPTRSSRCFRRREVGLVYQFYNLIPVLNVVENMTLPVLMDGRPVNEERLRTLLDGLGLRRP